MEKVFTFYKNNRVDGLFELFPNDLILNFLKYCEDRSEEFLEFTLPALIIVKFIGDNEDEGGLSSTFDNSDRKRIEGLLSPIFSEYYDARRRDGNEFELEEFLFDMGLKTKDNETKI